MQNVYLINYCVFNTASYTFIYYLTIIMPRVELEIKKVLKTVQQHYFSMPLWLGTSELISCGSSNVLIHFDMVKGSLLALYMFVKRTHPRNVNVIIQSNSPPNDLLGHAIFCIFAWHFVSPTNLVSNSSFGVGFPFTVHGQEIKLSFESWIMSIYYRMNVGLWWECCKSSALA